MFVAAEFNTATSSLSGGATNASGIGVEGETPAGKGAAVIGWLAEGGGCPTEIRIFESLTVLALVQKPFEVGVAVIDLAAID
jgi:hypothetical protein